MDWKAHTLWGFRDVGASSTSTAGLKSLSYYGYYDNYFASSNMFMRALLKIAIWECVNMPDPKGIHYTAV